ncbi:hypothetical protein BVRB_2g043140 isoform B [Beta vulgaris subsp. vulgaris]|nr:hypothetical protein BVRB_2g043140 isoform B [Beta vulgaris subsp. vulgaris]
MKAMETIRHNKELVQQARSAFVRRVNIVVEEHEVATTDTFKMCNSYLSLVFSPRIPRVMGSCGGRPLESQELEAIVIDTAYIFVTSQDT